MINKYLIWHKLQSKTYQVGEHSDDSMVTIA